jgi:hypothetical protein
MAIIYDTPEIFLTKTNHSYPYGNDLVFEDFFLQKFRNKMPDVKRTYIPVQWTCFYISRDYGNQPMTDLQEFLDNIPRDGKYFTVVQWDDGILNNLDGLDIIRFASGGIGDYPYPLNNLPHNKTNRDRDIFASFIGVINGRHRIREKLAQSHMGKQGYLIANSMGFPSFKEAMERSIFALCPRGYGRTSFRINEALNFGAIPVYIYDDPWIPFRDEIDFNEYGVLIHESEIEKIDDILKSYSESDIEKMRKKGQEVYKEYYLYDGCYNKIIEKVNKWEV